MDDCLFNNIRLTVITFSGCNEQELSELSDQLQTLSQTEVKVLFDAFVSLNNIISRQIKSVDPLLYELAVITCQQCGITMDDLVNGKKTSGEISMARQIFSYISRDVLFYHPRVISTFLNQDRTSINYQCKTLKNLLTCNKSIATAYININTRFRETQIFSDRRKERCGFLSKS